MVHNGSQRDSAAGKALALNISAHLDLSLVFHMVPQLPELTAEHWASIMLWVLLGVVQENKMGNKNKNQKNKLRGGTRQMAQG